MASGFITSLDRRGKSGNSDRFCGFPGGSVVGNLPANAGDVGSIPGSGRPLEKEMASHSSVLAWEIPWTEKPGGLQSMGLHRVGHNGAHTHEGDLVHR